MNKDILFIATVFVLIILAIYFVFINGGLSTNPTFNLLNSIKQDTQIDFSNIKEQQFIYKYESGGGQEIKGLGFVALNITNDQSDLIRDYFENNGFKLDFFEMSADFLGISYYSQEKNVCIFKMSILINQNESQIVNKFNTSVFCGTLEK